MAVLGHFFNVFDPHMGGLKESSNLDFFFMKTFQKLSTFA